MRERDSERKYILNSINAENILTKSQCMRGERDGDDDALIMNSRNRN